MFGQGILGFAGGAPSVEFSADFLVQAGGAGVRNAGGGGAGGLRTSYGTSGAGSSAEPSQTLFTGIDYNVTVGAGGAGYSSTNNGNDSVFNNVTSLGGGRSSANGQYYPPYSGGCGGGGCGPGTYTNGAAGTSGQGRGGGSGGCSPYDPSYCYAAGGGGGGTSAAGQNYPGGFGSDGGAGTSVSILSSSNASTASVGEVSSGNTYYGGGGAAADGWDYQTGDGGIGGGGGYGRSVSNPIGESGSVNSGGGGAAAAAGGGGGSGVVIVRYPNTFTATLSGLVQKSGSPFTEGSDIVTVIGSGTGTITFS